MFSENGVRVIGYEVILGSATTTAHDDFLCRVDALSLP
ncbi:Hypothetical protein EAG7_01662 [Klebsiella aerogenes]|jgi:hypothetical protein|nr:Hypothetical protein EAG7_01662 [Klebsiella aerogenes]PVF75276.1 hypothetical protein CSC18_2703 [Klebsiella aerogenes]CCG30137.1 hypothetical protein [Klebsiella aerogenes EA1509E]